MLISFLTVASFISLTLSRGFPDCENGPLAHNLVCNPDAPSLDRAKAVVAEFTLEELIANTGNDSPGVPRLGLAPYNWWNEALHGFGGSPGSNFSSEHGTPFSYSTSFPAPILMSAAFDDDLIHSVANVISTEGRAFHNFNRSGIDFWAPNINPFRDPRWGRGQETPGEDPLRVSGYVRAYIAGMQEQQEGYKKVLAQCKHWAGYDIENWQGNDRTEFNALITTQDFAEYYSPPFQACVRDAGVASVMCSYNEVNGVPSCANSYLLQTLVRDFWGLGDDQWIVGDCAAVEVIYTGHGYTEDIVNASALALKAGVDIDCGTTFPTYLGEALEKGLIAEDDIKKALVRQYHSLVRLFRPAFSSTIPPDWLARCQYQRNSGAGVSCGSRRLKNDGILPLSPKKTKVALIGPFANATRQMQSNYAQPAPYVISPLAAFLSSSPYDIVFANGTQINTTSTSEFPAALDAASEADVIIYIGGMDLSVEDEFRDRENIGWPGNQGELIQKLADVAGKGKGKSKKLVVVSMGGGQVDCSWIKKDSRVNALLWAGLPSQSGGRALLDILTGKKAPAGRLPVTQYPAGYVNEVPMTDMGLRPRAGEVPGRTYKWYTGKPVYEFGFGLHYTKFDIAWEKSETDFDVLTYNIQDLISTASNQQYIDLAPLDTFMLSVTNAGRTATSDYVALLFARTTAGPQPTPQKELIAYTRVKDVQPGQSTLAELTVTLGAIARTDENGDRVLYPGEYELLADWDGKAKKKLRLRGKEERLVVWPQPPS